MLALALTHRPYQKFDNGTYKSSRAYVDFLVDGLSLGTEFRASGHDLVSVFTREWAVDHVRRAYDRLVLTLAPEIPGNRRALYVCSECGNLGCGAITLFAEGHDDRIVWRDFGYENNYSDVVDFDKFKHLGPFEFDIEQYQRTLAEALALAL